MNHAATRVWLWGAMLTALVGAAQAQDWPQWRGPNRDGAAQGVKLPDPLPDQLYFRWELEVGQGEASPLVIGNRAFVFTRNGDEETLIAVDLVAGKEGWRAGYAAPRPPSSAGNGVRERGPRSTPAYADGRIVTLGAGGALSCWDIKTRRRLWNESFVKQFERAAPPGGTATSPLVDGERVIVYVGGLGKGALVACDLKSGAIVWSCDGDGPSSASPIIATLSGVRQVITLSQSSALGVEINTGKLLWKIPYAIEGDQNSVTPVIDDDTVIFSGYNRGLERYRIEQQGDEWRTDKIWENKEVSLQFSSPVASGERLFGYSHRQKGQFFSLDMTSGQTLWTGDGKQAESASLVRAGGYIWALTTRGELIAFRDSEKQFQPEARYLVATTSVWATPALLSSGALVKDENQLRYWTFESPQGKPGL